MLNEHESEPGLFFALRDGSLMKVGPVHIGANPPNSGATGYLGNTIGEIWLDTAGAKSEVKVWNGSEWLLAGTGPTGDKGDVGPKGNKGNQGVQGIKGNKGEVGDKGVKGNLGNKGNEGGIGPKGEKGDDNGPKGDRGFKGDQGLKGPQGDKGPKGDKGSKGDLGQKGQKGIDGILGGDGPKGDKGSKGLQGLSGLTQISDNHPVTPNIGDLWWDSDDGNLYIYYQDADTAQWVPAGNNGGTDPDKFPTVAELQDTLISDPQEGDNLQYNGVAWVNQSGGGGGNPTGTVIYVAMASAPEGYLAADGSAVSRSLYPDLFAAIGSTFGAGDGSTTFNLPDLRGEFIRGLDDGRGIDAGRTLGTAQDDATAINGLSLNDPQHTHSSAGSFSGGNTGSGNQVPQSTGSTGPASTGITLQSSDTETRPRNVALLACIKT